MAYITIADVREEMYDRQAEDHLVLIDIAFTDDDIEWAMAACARKYNSIEPTTSCVEADKLPFDTNIFMDGVCWALVRRWHRNVSMNDFQYNAGGVSANVQESLLQNLARLRDELERDFVSAAQNLKIRQNIQGAFGQIG